jgi:hypothetical protein
MDWGRLSIYKVGGGGWYVAHAPKSNVIKKTNACAFLTNLLLLS